MSKKLSGDRKNQGKPQLSLVPLALMESTARALEFGVEKYSRDNWRGGLPLYQILDCLMRHTHKLSDPNEPDIDEESGLHHVDCIAANVAKPPHIRGKLMT